MLVGSISLMFSFNFLCRPTTRILKKKKLKINVHRPVGTRVVFDEEGNTLPPLATLADTSATDYALLDKDKGEKHSLFKVLLHDFGMAQRAG